MSQGRCNARLEGGHFGSYCELAGEALALLERAVDRFNLSARAYRRVQRVARTIADLSGETEVAAASVAEALALRQLDKKR